jgi:hypothetical protein
MLQLAQLLLAKQRLHLGQRKHILCVIDVVSYG